MKAPTLRGVVGAIVERVVCEVFLACGLNNVGRLGIDKGRAYKARWAVCEGTKSEEDIHSGEQRDGPGPEQDGHRAEERSCTLS